jgi:multiple sugar transport system permease protein
VGEDNRIASQGRWASWLLAPTIIALGVVIVYPIISAIVMSFPEGRRPGSGHGSFHRGRTGRHPELCELAGAAVFSPGRRHSSLSAGYPGGQFWSATGTTFFFTVVTVAFETVLGFWMAMIMARTFKGRSLVRAAVLVPWAIPTAVTAKLWFFIFAFEGIANKLFNTSDPVDRQRMAGQVGSDHRRHLEDHAVYGAADPGRPADDSRPKSMRPPRWTAPVLGSGSG